LPTIKTLTKVVTNNSKIQVEAKIKEMTQDNPHIGQ
jgi:hypothetical protein